MNDKWKILNENCVLEIEENKNYYISYNRNLEETALCWGNHCSNENLAILKGDFTKEYEDCKNFNNCAEVYKSHKYKSCIGTIITDDIFLDYLNK